MAENIDLQHIEKQLKSLLSSKDGLFERIRRLCWDNSEYGAGHVPGEPYAESPVSLMGHPSMPADPVSEGSAAEFGLDYDAYRPEVSKFDRMKIASERFCEGALANFRGLFDNYNPSSAVSKFRNSTAYMEFIESVQAGAGEVEDIGEFTRKTIASLESGLISTYINEDDSANFASIVKNTADMASSKAASVLAKFRDIKVDSVADCISSAAESMVSGLFEEEAFYSPVWRDELSDIRIAHLRLFGLVSDKKAEMESYPCSKCDGSMRSFELSEKFLSRSAEDEAMKALNFAFAEKCPNLCLPGKPGEFDGLWFTGLYLAPLHNALCEAFDVDDPVEEDESPFVFRFQWYSNAFDQPTKFAVVHEALADHSLEQKESRAGEYAMKDVQLWAEVDGDCCYTGNFLCRFVLERNGVSSLAFCRLDMHGRPIPAREDGISVANGFSAIGNWGIMAPMPGEFLPGTCEDDFDPEKYDCSSLPSGEFEPVIGELEDWDDSMTNMSEAGVFRPFIPFDVENAMQYRQLKRRSASMKFAHEFTAGIVSRTEAKLRKAAEEAEVLVQSIDENAEVLSSADELLEKAELELSACSQLDVARGVEEENLKARKSEVDKARAALDATPMTELDRYIANCDSLHMCQVGYNRAAKALADIELKQNELNSEYKESMHEIDGLLTEKAQVLSGLVRSCAKACMKARQLAVGECSLVYLKELYRWQDDRMKKVFRLVDGFVSRMDSLEASTASIEDLILYFDYVALTKDGECREQAKEMAKSLRLHLIGILEEDLASVNRKIEKLEREKYESYTIVSCSDGEGTPEPGFLLCDVKDSEDVHDIAYFTSQERKMFKLARRYLSKSEAAEMRSRLDDMHARMAKAAEQVETFEKWSRMADISDLCVAGRISSLEGELKELDERCSASVRKERDSGKTRKLVSRKVAVSRALAKIRRRIESGRQSSEKTMKARLEDAKKELSERIGEYKAMMREFDRRICPDEATRVDIARRGLL